MLNSEIRIYNIKSSACQHICRHPNGLGDLMGPYTSADGLTASAKLCWSIWCELGPQVDTPTPDPRESKYMASDKATIKDKIPFETNERSSSKDLAVQPGEGWGASSTNCWVAHQFLHLRRVGRLNTISNDPSMRIVCILLVTVNREMQSDIFISK